MLVRNLEFFIKEAFLGYLRSGIMSIVSVATITISLVVFGIFLLILFNVNSLIDGLSNKLEIVLYINNVSQNEKNVLQERITEVEGVKEVYFIPKEKAWDSFQQNFQGKVSMEGILQHNPLPDSFVVQVEDIKQIPETAAKFAKFPEINDIRYGGELADRISKFVNSIKILGFSIIGLLGFATLLIVVNTIRLTILARENEIKIMKLVGATDQFIKWPFILEGIFIGITGSLISTIFLMFLYNITTPYLQQALPFLPFVFSQKKIFLVYLNVIISGISLGFFGAYLSVGKSLKAKKYV